jgi:hypothetical protein
VIISEGLLLDYGIECSTVLLVLATFVAVERAMEPPRGLVPVDGET